MQIPGPPGWALDTKMTTLLFKNITVAISKEVKTGQSDSRQIWQKLLRKLWLKRGLFCR
jgi:hypothetical protein